MHTQFSVLNGRDLLLPDAFKIFLSIDLVRPNIFIFFKGATLIEVLLIFITSILISPYMVIINIMSLVVLYITNEASQRGTDF